MSLAFYDAQADRLAQRYEAVQADEVHADWLGLLPSTRLLVLDIGAGSGRDAAWFAGQGHEVVAVEPSEGMRTRGQALHPHPSIRWIDDRLPGLPHVYDLDYRFDVIVLSAVWMHVAPSKRERAFRKVTDLLKPGGLLVLSFRTPPADDGRTMYDVDASELRHLAHRRALEVVRIYHSDDQLGRIGVEWTTVVLRLPDDGTGALPLLRHVLVNDDTSATYKPALLRAILRVASVARGAVIEQTSDYVVIPLGLVALYWLRMYRWLLIENGYRQLPSPATPGFDKDDFRALSALSDADLRVGRRHTGALATHLIEALRKVRDTIRNGPAHYITYPGSTEQVFTYEGGHLRSATSVTLDQAFFRTLGTLQVPRHAWDALTRHACWIEPVIVSRWAELMEKYDGTADRGDYMSALTWRNLEHATGQVRSRVAELSAQGAPLYCVWSGTRLDDDYHIDHCFPFSYWPNNDLWNLLPVTPRVNHSKSNKLPSAVQLERARDRLCDWWGRAYREMPYEAQFFEEARTTLPMATEGVEDYDDVLLGLDTQRVRLKTDQQIAEWEHAGK